MKKLIVSVVKTLLFFDASIIVMSIVVKNNIKNPALSGLWREGIAFVVMALFSFVFSRFVEKNTGLINLKFKTSEPKRSYLSQAVAIMVPVFSLGLIYAFKQFSILGISKLDFDLVYWLLACFFNAAAAELLFRGYLYRIYRANFGRAAAVVITLLLYISLNLEIFQKSKIFIVNVILLNLLLCFVLEFTNSLAITVMVRFIYTFVVNLVMGAAQIVPNCPALIKTEFGQNQRISGGEYGIHGSYVLTALIVIPTVIVIWNKLEIPKLIKTKFKLLRKKR